MEISNPNFGSDHPGPTGMGLANQWVCPGWAWDIHVARLVTAGRLFYNPIFVARRTAYDRIGISVAVGDGVGGLGDLRIFNMEAGIPTSLILSAGTVSTNVAGAKEIIIAQTLDRGYHCLAIRCDQSPELHGMNVGGVSKSPIGGFEGTNIATGLDLMVGRVTGVFTDPATAPTTGHPHQDMFVRLREA